MRAVRWIHRWTGALIGLLLALIGLSGAILAWKDEWIGVPGAEAVSPRTPEALAAATQAIMDGNSAAESIVFASDSFGLHRIYAGKESGAYADGAGRIVASWDSVWDRPELWLFDFHHHLFGGEAGETVSGILALIGIGFIVTGVLLWWRTRRSFAFRLWPKRMTQSAIVRQHRDLGIIIAPILFLSCLTGAMMTLKPLASLLLSPFSSPAVMQAATYPPKGDFGAMPARLDWLAIYREARTRFPRAELRVLRAPKQAGDPFHIRMKQPTEWLPNGRTLLWFAPDGRLIEARNALRHPQGLRIFNTLYPLHSGKVGGIVWKALVTFAGLALFVLGLLASWSFWRNNLQPRASVAKQV